MSQTSAVAFPLFQQISHCTSRCILNRSFVYGSLTTLGIFALKHVRNYSIPRRLEQAKRLAAKENDETLETAIKKLQDEFLKS